VGGSSSEGKAEENEVGVSATATPLALHLRQHSTSPNDYDEHRTERTPLTEADSPPLPRFQCLKRWREGGLRNCFGVVLDYCTAHFVQRG
jgi:hypothetical protein